MVSITLAQLWLGLAACHYFANQKANVTFIFLNERKETFKYKWHQIQSNRGSSIWVQQEEVVRELAFYFMCLTQEGKKNHHPLLSPQTNLQQRALTDLLLR